MNKRKNLTQTIMSIVAAAGDIGVPFCDVVDQLNLPRKKLQTWLYTTGHRYGVIRCANGNLKQGPQDPGNTSPFVARMSEVAMEIALQRAASTIALQRAEVVEACRTVGVDPTTVHLSSTLRSQLNRLVQESLNSLVGDDSPVKNKVEELTTEELTTELSRRMFLRQTQTWRHIEQPVAIAPAPIPPIGLVDVASPISREEIKSAIRTVLDVPQPMTVPPVVVGIVGLRRGQAHNLERDPKVMAHVRNKAIKLKIVPYAHTTDHITIGQSVEKVIVCMERGRHIPGTIVRAIGGRPHRLVHGFEEVKNELIDAAMSR